MCSSLSLVYTSLSLLNFSSSNLYFSKKNFFLYLIVTNINKLLYYQYGPILQDKHYTLDKYLLMKIKIHLVYFKFIQQILVKNTNMHCKTSP